jgi:uncharacterized protein YraI
VKETSRSGGDGAVNNPMRGVRGLARRAIALGAILTLALGALAVTPMDTVASGADGVTTIDDLNLRAEPALNAAILDVMPAGAAVEVTGDAVAGFYPVAYGGQSGWAYGAYLTLGATGDGVVTTGGQQGEVYVADGPVNFRTGPSTEDAIISVIPDGALVALNGDSANGFLSIIYTDRSGWAHADSVFGTSEANPAPVEVPAAPVVPDPPADPPQPAVPDDVPVGDGVTGAATVVDGALNLRTGPSLDHPVVMVMPDSAAVELRGEDRAGFSPVSYDGTAGWAFAEFLRVDAPEGPAVPDSPAPQEPAAPETPELPWDGSDGYTEAEIIAIIYAAADEYGQPREDMLRVARCESVLDPYAVNATSGASGLFQFLDGTWAWTPWADQDVFDPVANAYATAWMWDQGNRHEWVCQ